MEKEQKESMKDKATPVSKNEQRERKPLTEEQRLRRKKMLVYPLMALACAVCLWLIFSPSQAEKESENKGKGFNTEMPDADSEKIMGDKRKAYESVDLERRQKEKRKAMGDLSDLWGDRMQEGTDKPSDDYSLLGQAPQPTEAEKREASTIRSSAAAYRDLNTTLGNFYEQPREDTEKDELRKRIDELEASLMKQEAAQPTMDDQVKLLEKSYELAAKYMPDKENGSVSTAGSASSSETCKEGTPKDKVKKPKAVPVGQVKRRVVSSLAASLADNITASFHTPIGTEAASLRNTLAACVHSDQTVTDGQTVKLRLLEAMRTGNRIIPRNTVIVGSARIQGERLGISLSSVEHNGMIIPVELSVYDSDGQEGIFIPNSLEVDALKEVGANMGSSLGSGINISTDAGAQLASDLGKGVIQGVSQYISKKMRTVKVHLKAGYKVLLYQEEN